MKRSSKVTSNIVVSIVLNSLVSLSFLQVRLQLQEKLDVDLTDRKKEVDQLVMQVIDEQTQEDDEEGSGEEEEEEEEEEKPKKKAPVKKAAPKRKTESSGEEDEAEASGDDSEAEKPPSDGGGSDYEPDEPVKAARGAYRVGSRANSLVIGREVSAKSTFKEPILHGMLTIMLDSFLGSVHYQIMTESS